MAFQVSPGVQVKEIDLTSIIPAVATTRAGFAGEFDWGPAEVITTVTGVNSLRENFSDPSDTNFISWFTAANFLAYTNNLQVVRVLGSGALNSTSIGTGLLIKNRDDYDSKSASDLGDNVWIAKFAGGASGANDGTLGNSIQVSAFNRTTTNIELFDFNTFGSTAGVATSGSSTESANFSPPAADKTFYFASNTLVADGFTKGTVIDVANVGTTGQNSADNLLIEGLNSRLVTGTTAAVAFSMTAGNTGTGFTIGGASTGITGLRVVGTTTPGSNIAGGVTGTQVRIHTTGFGGAAVELLGMIRGITAEANAMTLDIAFNGEIGATFFAAAGATIDILGTIEVGSTAANQAGKTAAQITPRYASNFTTNLPATSQFTLQKGATNDLLNVAVIDYAGDWTGNTGEVLEVFDGVSVNPNAKDFAGNSIYYKNVINDQSEYIYFGAKHIDAGSTLGMQPGGTDNLGNAGASFGVAAGSGTNYHLLPKAATVQLGGGTSGTAVTDFITNGFDKFSDTETVDVNILVGGGVSGNNAKSVAEIALNRKDAIAFFSPPQDAVLDSTGSSPLSQIQATANAVAYRKGLNGNVSGGSKDYTSANLNINNSYAVLDSGWKYCFDRYNDVFRYVPLNADTAGVTVRTDILGEPWFSPAGFNRGQLNGVVKLAYSPVKSQRDDLYSSQVNPVVSFPGQGTVLFGDKTMQSSPSAFDRINVRRLFIILEKAISTAAKFQLFEINDAFTRSQFRGLVEPFLRDVQARRGITDFKVVCDESNNTSSVIDRNEFVASIFVKPTRSINFITLNFIASATGVNFDEIGG